VRPPLFTILHTSPTHIQAIGGFLFPALGLKGMMLLLALLPLLMALGLLTALGPRGVGRRRRHFPTTTTPFSTASELDQADESEPFDVETLAGLSSGPLRSRPGASSWWADATVVLVALALVGDAAALGFLDPTMAQHLQLLLGLGVGRIGACSGG
jgi:hypothetical protein